MHLPIPRLLGRHASCKPDADVGADDGEAEPREMGMGLVDEDEDEGNERTECRGRGGGAMSVFGIYSHRTRPSSVLYSVYGVNRYDKGGALNVKHAVCAV